MLRLCNRRLRLTVFSLDCLGSCLRRWSDEDRVRVLAEAMAPGAIASHVARRFGVSTGQFYTWRKAVLLRSAEVGVTLVLIKADFAEVWLSAPNPKPSAALPIGGLCVH
jgi:hypothetical protein